MEFGKYRLLEKIGQGGMAEVFYAHIIGSEGFTKEVALKRVLPHLCEDADFVKSFIDEARLGGLLNHHHIVQTLDFGNEQGLFYLAMEYVHGLTLREILNYHARNKIPIPPPVVLDLALQLCDGLRYAHQAEDENGNPIQMVHRDLKPTNILVNSHGVVKIADFGIARAETNSRRTALGGILKGTAQYMSPEQAYGELGIDRRSDIFSFGSILYELVTLKPLFYDANSSVQTIRNVQDAEVDGPLAAMAQQFEYARQLHPILRHLLGREPSDRPSEISEVIGHLRQIQASFSRLTDMQSWTEQILLELGRPVKSRRSSASRLNVPVADPGDSFSLPDPVQESQFSSAGSSSPPNLALDPFDEPAPPTMAALPADLAAPSFEEKTPVAQLRELPGQPRIREKNGQRSIPPSEEWGTQIASPGFQPELDETTPRGQFTDTVPRHSVERTNTPSSYLSSGEMRTDITRTSGMTEELEGRGGRTVTETPTEFPGGFLNEEALPELRYNGSGRELPQEYAAFGPPGELAEPVEPVPPSYTPPFQATQAPVQALSSAAPHGTFLETTPAWIEQEEQSASRRAGEAPSPVGHGGDPKKKSSKKTLQILGVAGGIALAGVVVIFLAGRLLSSGPPPDAAPKRVTIDTIPGGAEVTFKDPGIESGRTPLTRSLRDIPSCLEVDIRRDGYEEARRCLPIPASGFPEPVLLRPAPRASGVVFYYPLTVSGLTILADGWAVDLRQQRARPNDQGSVRTYVSLARHTIEVKSDSCGEISEEFDFAGSINYTFIKIVQESQEPCTLAFARDKP